MNCLLTNSLFFLGDVQIAEGVFPLNSAQDVNPDGFFIRKFHLEKSKTSPF